MTLQGVGNSYYTSSLYGSTSSSTAASAFLQLAGSSDGGSSTSSISQKQTQAPPPPPSEADMEAAKQKLEEIDPELADKMEQFHDQMDELQSSGASRETIESTMKEQMDSLSDTEKSELDSVFGSRGPGGSGGPGGPGGAGAPPDMMSDLISSLGSSDSALAEKLQSYQDEISQMQEDGASEDEIQQAMQKQLDSLSDSEKSEIEDAMQTLMQSKQSEQSNAAFWQSQVNSAYVQQAQTQAFAFAA